MDKKCEEFINNLIKKIKEYCSKDVEGLKDVVDILIRQTEKTNIFDKSVEIIEKIADDVCETEISKNSLKLNCNDIKYCYGVYIIECVCGQSKKQECKCNKNYRENDDEFYKKKTVLYIGKGGTIKKCVYNEQDVIGRLGNTKKDSMGAKKWFNCLLSICETICNCHGSEGENSNSQYHLAVKIICLDKFNEDGEKKPKCLAPGFVESLLLQVYFLENQHLPIINNEL